MCKKTSRKFFALLVIGISLFSRADDEEEEYDYYDEPEDTEQSSYWNDYYFEPPPQPPGDTSIYVAWALQAEKNPPKLVLAK